jgi:putative FmdB family regulatory protein
MPIYEYECSECGNRMQVLVISRSEGEVLECDRCKGRSIRRIMSRVVFHVSEADRLADYDPSGRKSDSFYRDSRNIGLHAKKQAERMGVDLGSGFEEKLEKLRTDPGSVIRDSQ